MEKISSPLNVEVWERVPVGHPDEELVVYLLSRIREGFWVGFNYLKEMCMSAEENLPSAGEHGEIVTEYLREEQVVLLGLLESVIGLHI